ncbi:MAG: winged helix-turn-helix domain-containing protein [Candidatus Dormiibacterota bacterium]
MTFLDAARAVLKASNREMTCGEVTERALRRGLIKTKGKTPEASMSAALYSAVKSDPEGEIRRVCDPGPTRAARDSVRWLWTGR